VLSAKKSFKSQFNSPRITDSLKASPNNNLENIKGSLSRTVFPNLSKD